MPSVQAVIFALVLLNAIRLGNALSYILNKLLGLVTVLTYVMHYVLIDLHYGYNL